MTTLTKREIAVAILRQEFAQRPRIAISEIVALAAERGVSRRTLTRACRDVGIHEVHNGPYGGFWERNEPS